MISLMRGDCLALMPYIPDGSVDLILTDPPYGTTQCKWDSVIPLAPMWAQLKRIIKPKGAIALFGSEPFSSALRMSNIGQYKYDWYFDKRTATGFLNSKKMPLKIIECVSVFQSSVNYIPQMRSGFKPYKATQRVKTECYGTQTVATSTSTGGRYPITLLSFSKDKKGAHPTQKPVALLEYLIKTYANGGDTVLDFTMGSGSTGVACVNTGRNFIGIELDKKYFKIAEDRIASALKGGTL